MSFVKKTHFQLCGKNVPWVITLSCRLKWIGKLKEYILPSVIGYSHGGWSDTQAPIKSYLIYTSLTLADKRGISYHHTSHRLTVWTYYGVQYMPLSCNNLASQRRLTYWWFCASHWRNDHDSRNKQSLVVKLYHKGLLVKVAKRRTISYVIFLHAELYSK